MTNFKSENTLNGYHLCTNIQRNNESKTYLSEFKQKSLIIHNDYLLISLEQTGHLLS